MWQAYDFQVLKLACAMYSDTSMCTFVLQSRQTVVHVERILYSELRGRKKKMTFFDTKCYIN